MRITAAGAGTEVADSSPKFLTVRTDNEDLNRVQDNVAEALRRLENRIATAIITPNTVINNNLTTAIYDVYPPNVQEIIIYGKSVGINPSNVIGWVLPEGYCETILGSVVGSRTVNVSGGATATFSAYFSRSPGGGGNQEGATHYLQQQRGGVAVANAAVLTGSGNSIICTCTGDGVNTFYWAAVIRRTLRKVP